MVSNATKVARDASGSQANQIIDAAHQQREADGQVDAAAPEGRRVG